MKRLSFIFMGLLLCEATYINEAVAQTDNSETQKVLQEAKEMLQKAKALIATKEQAALDEETKSNLRKVLSQLINENTQTIEAKQSTREELHTQALKSVKVILIGFNDNPLQAKTFFDSFTTLEKSVLSDLVAEHYSNQLLEKMDSASVQEMNTMFLNAEANLSRMFQIQRNLTEKLFDKALKMQGSNQEGLTEKQLKSLEFLATQVTQGVSDHQISERSKGFSESILNAYRDAYIAVDATVLSNAKALIKTLGNILSNETLKEITRMILDLSLIKDTFESDVQVFEHLATVSEVCGSEVMLKNLQDIFKDQSFSDASSDLTELVEELNSTLESFKREQKTIKRKTILERFKSGIEAIKRFFTLKTNAETKRLKQTIKEMTQNINQHRLGDINGENFSTQILEFINERIKRRDFKSIIDVLKNTNEDVDKVLISQVLLQITPESRIKVMRMLSPEKVKVLFDSMKQAATFRAELEIDELIKSRSTKSTLEKAFTQNSTHKAEQEVTQQEVTQDEAVTTEETSQRDNQNDQKNQLSKETAETSLSEIEPERTSTQEQRIESNKETDERKSQSERRARQEGEKSREAKNKRTKHQTAEEFTYRL